MDIQPGGHAPPAPARRPRAPCRGRRPSLRPFFTNPPRSGGMSRGGGNGSMPGGAYRACHGPQRQGCPRFWQASQALQNDFCSLTCSLRPRGTCGVPSPHSPQWINNLMTNQDGFATFINCTLININYTLINIKCSSSIHQVLSQVVSSIPVVTSTVSIPYIKYTHNNVKSELSSS